MPVIRKMFQPVVSERILIDTIIDTIAIAVNRKISLAVTDSLINIGHDP